MVTNDFQTVAQSSVKCNSVFLRAEEIGTIVVHDFTVPTGKRWTIFNVFAQSQKSGDIKINLLDTIPKTMILVKETFATDDVFLNKEFNTPLVLSAGMKIQVLYNCLSGVLRTLILYCEETENTG